MIVAAGSGRGADEDRIDEQRRGEFLQPQPRMAYGARDDVSRDREREAETQDAAEDHQDQFELVERPPFEVALPRQYQFVGDGHRLSRRVGFAWSGRVSPGHPRLWCRLKEAEDARDKPGTTASRQLIARIRFLIFSACGPSSLASLSR